jgi:hypothetical protein
MARPACALLLVLLVCVGTASAAETTTCSRGKFSFTLLNGRQARLAKRKTRSRAPELSQELSSIPIQQTTAGIWVYCSFLITRTPSMRRCPASPPFRAFLWRAETTQPKRGASVVGFAGRAGCVHCRSGLDGLTQCYLWPRQHANRRGPLHATHARVCAACQG